MYNYLRHVKTEKRGGALENAFKGVGGVIEVGLKNLKSLTSRKRPRPSSGNAEPTGSNHGHGGSADADADADADSDSDSEPDADANNVMVDALRGSPYSVLYSELQPIPPVSGF
jgi:hypothetical protein